MGFVVTPEKQERFRTLDIDAQGKVILADFTALCKEMFRFESGDGNLNFENQLTLALTQKDSLDFPISNAVASGEVITVHRKVIYFIIHLTTPTSDPELGRIAKGKLKGRENPYCR